jgi:hypothetical protein
MLLAGPLTQCMTEGGVQLYTANTQNSAGTRKKIHGGVQGGDGYPKEGQRSRTTFEPMSDNPTHRRSLP